ncbi:MAG: HDIG domain-containing protein [Clostridia bacterium]|nr:HDIG domain-containing protein [Clostridia bacterium]
MLFSKAKQNETRNHIKSYIKSKTFQRVLIAVITVCIAFIIIETGAAPKKYKLNLGDKSEYDILAPRDIENKILTEHNKKVSLEAVRPVTKEITAAPIEVLNSVNDFFTEIENSKKSVDKSLQDQGITKRSKNYRNQLELEQELASNSLYKEIKKMNIPLSMEQVRYLIAKTDDEAIGKFKKVVTDLLSNVMKEEITNENLANQIDRVQNSLQGNDLSQDLKNIGGLFVKAVLKPNRTIDNELTNVKRKEAYDNPQNVVKILKDTRIISYGDTVTEDKLAILEDLNLLETKSRFDFGFAGGIFVILLLLTAFLILFMNYFCKQILYDQSDTVLLCVIMLLTLGIARWVGVYYTPIAIPIFMATMLISILLSLELAIVSNFVLAISISFMTQGDLRFIYMALISGVFSAFLVSKANQRSKLSMAGLIIGVLNVLIIVCYGIINKSDLKTIVMESTIVFLNGLVSMILTLGILPFLESTFNILTPLKLLELANPNQKLIKRLLMEAPGTYHHSLMVGNLAEVATEAIGGNALLARVGAYFHDVGKLKRPNFFIENQMSDNPHDRMTANLSTLVITSHTHDGVELAEKYKVPLAIRDIIKQHHGTTLVAYFYHKAKKGEKGEAVKPENFRYEGPKPSTKEAAVVMLADSVEAAVRSMVDKTEGKIEGLIRKIIKDKLDDGQLDQCELTLKDLDIIAKSFMRVLSGYFHAREEYPDVKAKPKVTSEEKPVEIAAEGLYQQRQEEGSVLNGSIN